MTHQTLWAFVEPLMFLVGFTKGLAGFSESILFSAIWQLLARFYPEFENITLMVMLMTLFQCVNLIPLCGIWWKQWVAHKHIIILMNVIGVITTPVGFWIRHNAETGALRTILAIIALFVSLMKMIVVEDEVVAAKKEPVNTKEFSMKGKSFISAVSLVFRRLVPRQHLALLSTMKGWFAY